jgi:hypothetical protein
LWWSKIEFYIYCQNDKEFVTFHHAWLQQVHVERKAVHQVHVDDRIEVGIAYQVVEASFAYDVHLELV